MPNSKVTNREAKKLQVVTKTLYSASKVVILVA
jgi:hypothetical protein